MTRMMGRAFAAGYMGTLGAVAALGLVGAALANTRPIVPPRPRA